MSLRTYCEGFWGPVLSQGPACLCNDCAASAPSEPGITTTRYVLLRGKCEFTYVDLMESRCFQISFNYLLKIMNPYKMYHLPDYCQNLKYIVELKPNYLVTFSRLRWRFSLKIIYMIFKLRRQVKDVMLCTFHTAHKQCCPPFEIFPKQTKLVLKHNRLCSFVTWKLHFEQDQFSLAN